MNVCVVFDSCPVLSVFISILVSTFLADFYSFMLRYEHYDSKHFGSLQIRINILFAVILIDLNSLVLILTQFNTVTWHQVISCWLMDLFYSLLFIFAIVLSCRCSHRCNDCLVSVLFARKYISEIDCMLYPVLRTEIIFYA